MYVHDYDRMSGDFESDIEQNFVRIFARAAVYWTWNLEIPSFWWNCTKYPVVRTSLIVSNSTSFRFAPRSTSGFDVPTSIHWSQRAITGERKQRLELLVDHSSRGLASLTPRFPLVPFEKKEERKRALSPHVLTRRIYTYVCMYTYVRMYIYAG